MELSSRLLTSPLCIYVGDFTDRSFYRSANGPQFSLGPGAGLEPSANGPQFSLGPGAGLEPSSNGPQFSLVPGAGLDPRQMVPRSDCVLELVSTLCGKGKSVVAADYRMIPHSPAHSLVALPTETSRLS
jgi:hypothetical protein